MDGALLRGISVSKWQGDIDWAKVAAMQALVEVLERAGARLRA